MSDVWGSEAREAVAEAIQDGMNDVYPNPWCGCGSINRAADAVLAALTPHATPDALSAMWAAQAVEWMNKHDALRAAVLAKAQEWEKHGSPGSDLGLCAVELRALAGGEP